MEENREEKEMQRGKKSSEELMDEVIETAKKATKKAGSTAKEMAKKADNVVTEAKKAVRKPLKEEVYLQYMGKEISKDDLMRQVKEIWTKQLKRKVGEMSTVTLYLKPEENKVYYVINGEESGSLDI